MKGKDSELEYRIREVVLGAVDSSMVCIHKHLIGPEHALYVRARLAEDLSIAMKLGLITSEKAVAIGNDADTKICSHFNLKFISDLNPKFDEELRRFANVESSDSGRQENA